MKKTLEPYQLIERSIIKKYRKELWTPFIVAVKRYELVQAGDRISVCISGGKDSMLMAKLIQCACRFTENCTMCDNGGGSKRQEVKTLLRRLKRENPNIENSIFRSIHAVALDTMPGYKSEVWSTAFWNASTKKSENFIPKIDLF